MPPDTYGGLSSAVTYPLSITKVIIVDHLGNYFRELKMLNFSD